MVANLHTVDGVKKKGIPSASRENFLGTALGNVLVGCAATPALGHQGIWVACGDTNMSIVAATSQLRKQPGQLTMVASPDDKRDFIISSGQLQKYRPMLFLARDGQHWAVAAHVALGDLSDTSEGDTGPVSAATRDLQEAAKAAAAAHVEEQRQITASADAALQEEARLAELAEIEQAELQQMEQQQVIIDGPGFATRLHHWQVSKSHSDRVEFPFVFQRFGCVSQRQTIQGCCYVP